MELGRKASRLAAFRRSWGVFVSMQAMISGAVSQFTFLNMVSAFAVACAREPFARGVTNLAELGPPLVAIALWNCPLASVIARRSVTLEAPADSPKIVILSGFPPNDVIFCLTHLSAATWSRSR